MFGYTAVQEPRKVKNDAYAKAIEMNRGNRVQERYEATVDWIWL